MTTTNGGVRYSPRSIRFRYIADLKKGRLAHSDPATNPSGKKAPYLTMDYLRGGREDPTLVSVGPDSVMASEESLILLWDGSNAGEFLAGKRGVVASTSALVTPRNVDTRFFFWACKAQEHQLQAETIGMGVPHVNGEVLANLRFRLPPPQQQRTIANYLDRKTTRLDDLIVATERVRALLAEKRHAIITQAITRGLEANGIFKASGIPWIGDCPCHWGVWKLGHVCTVGNGSTPSRTNPDYWTKGTIPWLNSSVVNQHEVSEADQFVTDLAVRERHLPLVKRGSVLVAITGQGKTRGKAAVLSLDATVSQHLVYVSPDRSRLAPWFLKWTFLAAYDFLRNISDDAGGTKGALTCEDIHNLRVPVPPINEQLQIVAHIQDQASKLLELLEGLGKTLSLLEERRASLITEALTGRLAME